MSLRTKILALLHQEGASADEPDNGAATQPGAVPADSGTGTQAATSPTAMNSAEPEQLRRELAAERAKGYRTAAEAFADGVKDRITPAQREPLVSALIQAAADDAASPLESGSRVATIKASYQAAPKHHLTEELVPANAEVLANQAGGAKSEEDLAIERVAKLAVRNGRAGAAANGRAG